MEAIAFPDDRKNASRPVRRNFPNNAHVIIVKIPFKDKEQLVDVDVDSVIGHR